MERRRAAPTRLLRAELTQLFNDVVDRQALVAEVGRAKV
jgi:hypothetical protein